MDPWRYLFFRSFSLKYKFKLFVGMSKKFYEILEEEVTKNHAVDEKDKDQGLEEMWKARKLAINIWKIYSNSVTHY